MIVPNAAPGAHESSQRNPAGSSAVSRPAHGLGEHFFARRDRRFRHCRPGLRLAAAAAGVCRSSVFEANDYAGGHTHTVDVTLDGITRAGGHRLPRLQRSHLSASSIALFDELGIESAPSTMSFAVRDDERRGSNGRAPTSRRCSRSRRNLARPAFWRMLADILRFNRDTTALQRADARLLASRWANISTSGGYSRAVSRLVPAADGRGDLVGAACGTCSIFRCRRSCGSATATGCCRSSTGRNGAPSRRRAHLCRAHRRAAARRAPVDAGAPRSRADANHVEIDTSRRRRPSASTRSCSPATATRRSALLADPTPQRSATLLGSVRYQSNRVVLHTDTRLMPRRAARGRRGTIWPARDATASAGAP